jgi:hypothetical protein
VSSIYRQALGDEFGRLHPRIQARFGFSSKDEKCQIGTGVMEEVWRGGWWTLPFLWIGSARNILIPNKGKEVPFSVGNYAYVDSYGRETMTWSRRFRFPRRVRAFDATMVAGSGPGHVVDYLGTHQHLAVDIELSVEDGGGIRLRSGDQRFYEGPIAFRFPRLFSGDADVREWWDEETERYRIEVLVSNRYFGTLFGYRGWFTVVERPCTFEEIPLDARPVREEQRP